MVYAAVLVQLKLKKLIKNFPSPNNTLFVALSVGPLLNETKCRLVSFGLVIN